MIYSTAAQLALDPPYLFSFTCPCIFESDARVLTRPVPAFTGSRRFTTPRFLGYLLGCKDGQLVLGIYSINVTSITEFVSFQFESTYYVCISLFNSLQACSNSVLYYSGLVKQFTSKICLLIGRSRHQFLWLISLVLGSLSVEPYICYHYLGVQNFVLFFLSSAQQNSDCMSLFDYIDIALLSKLIRLVMPYESTEKNSLFCHHQFLTV